MLHRHWFIHKLPGNQLTSNNQSRACRQNTSIKIWLYLLTACWSIPGSCWGPSTSQPVLLIPSNVCSVGFVLPGGSLRDSSGSGARNTSNKLRFKTHISNLENWHVSKLPSEPAWLCFAHCPVSFVCRIVENGVNQQHNKAMIQWHTLRDYLCDCVKCSKDSFVFCQHRRKNRSIHWSMNLSIGFMFGVNTGLYNLVANWKINGHRSGCVHVSKERFVLES